tara:strand:- start:15 stop:287 length:273 start_codon:yes stop_codon:yes gene_type:complete
MPKTRKTKNKKTTKPSIFVSPDGGETVYEQLPNGERRLVEQSRLAKDMELEQEEMKMIGLPAIPLRRKYPALQKAWEQYRSVWHLITGNE